ncbi:MAG: dephospho-CoA kinase [Clostridia bacterium]|nr:dephospho-CoA kinase [Clostridia bacterium]
MNKIIGLTGPTGSGKSSAALIAKNYGIKVVDCDKLARKAVKKGSDGLNDLVAAFSPGILKKDGALNRRELAKRAFSSKKNTELLNKTLLPHIAKLVKAELNGKTVLLDAPTLFESGLDSVCDVTIAVLANKDDRIKRIMERDKLSLENALLRINAGKDDGFYIERADFVLYNNKDIQKYINEISSIFHKYTEE